MTQPIAALCAGASQGLVTSIAERLRRELGVHTTGRFGAVGAMKEAFVAGEDCDFMILTDAMIRAMVADGQLRADTVTPLGSVRTGVAVPVGRALPDVSTAEALASVFTRASSLWIPDTVKSTAGIHMRKVINALGLAASMEPKLREFPNGATAMRAMAESGDPAAIGCTQVSEILFTSGVALVGPLPKVFELGTVYSAAVSSRAANAAIAQSVIALLASESSAALRSQCGFE